MDELNHCTNRDLGLLLHAYELGMLADDERSAFEQHLLECSHCFELARGDEEAMRMLATDPIIQGKLNEPVGTGVERGRIKLWRWFALAAVVLITALPAWFFTQSGDSGGSRTQTVVFDQFRSGSATVVDRAEYERVRFQFPITNERDSDSLLVTIQALDTEYTLTRTVEIESGAESGFFQLPTDELKVGLYLMIVGGFDSESAPVEYSFRVR